LSLCFVVVQIGWSCPKTPEETLENLLIVLVVFFLEAHGLINKVCLLFDQKV